MCLSGNGLWSSLQLNQTFPLIQRLQAKFEYLHFNYDLAFAINMQKQTKKSWNSGSVWVRFVIDLYLCFSYCVFRNAYLWSAKEINFTKELRRKGLFLNSNFWRGILLTQCTIYIILSLYFYKRRFYIFFLIR